MPEKIIRDPVHDVIVLRTERSVDGLLFRLLGAVEVQRLRRIRQLGLASLAYPGADHSRYSHSLGVMETARQMLARLRQSFSISEEDETICLAAALLHDLGHGPLSHVFESVSGIQHEKLSRRIIEDPDSDVHRLLAGHDRQLPRRIVQFMQGLPCRSFLCDIYSSQLDADRFDYLLRDNLMTGSRYGGFDLRWVLHTLTVDRSSDRLAVTWKGISAVEAYLQSRYHMYRNVYFHKVVRSAEGMVRLTLQRARRLAVQDRLDWPTPRDPVHKALLGRRLTTAEYTELDDVSILHAFKTWALSGDEVLAGLCRGLLYRRLYKTIDISRADDAEQALPRAEQAVTAAGGDAAYDLFYDEPAAAGYQTGPDDPLTAAGEILMQDVTGTVTEFAAISPLAGVLNQQLMFRRIHVAEPWKDAVAAAIDGGAQ